MLFDISAIINNTYSYIILFVLVMASSIVIVPEIELLVATFASLALGIHNLVMVIILVLIASLLGDIVAYSLARIFSVRLKKYLKRFKWFSRDEVKTRKALYKYGFISIFLSRFLFTGVGLAINYLSGFEKYNIKKFVTSAFLGQLVSAVMYSLIGYIFKDTWTELIGSVQNILIAAAIFGVAAYALIKVLQYYRKKMGL